MKARWTAWLLVCPLAAAQASDYLFLNKRYVQLTRQIVEQADAQAARLLERGSAPAEKYAQTSGELRSQLDEIARAKLLKKLKPELVAQVKDERFAKNLNDFKFALTFMAQKAGRTPAGLFPAFEDWVKTELAVVQMGLAQRLQAFETRFGPESEQVNFVELFAGEAFFRGDEAAPSPWEPIVRLSAVQLTTAGPGLTSTFQAGMNYYFVKSSAPSILRWIGVDNHVGLAASLQYLSDPRLMRFEGRPSFGIMLHLNRKELGANWDPDEETVRLTLGYSFQFVPFVL